MNLILWEIPGTKTVQELETNEALFRILLIVLSALFALILSGLIIAFIYRTRALNRQLKAYSASDLDSAPSHLNRKEAPATNVFSVEGTNPATHNGNHRKALFDEESIQSDDSDMIGFDDHPDFVKEGIDGIPVDHTESLNIARIKDIRQNSKNPMANGAGGTIHSSSLDLDRDSLGKY